MALTLVFINRQQAVPLHLNGIQCPCTVVFIYRFALGRGVRVVLSEWAENFLHAELAVATRPAIGIAFTDISHVQFHDLLFYLSFLHVIIIIFLDSLALTLFVEGGSLVGVSSRFLR